MSPDIGLLFIVALAGWWRTLAERRQHTKEIEAAFREMKARMNYGRNP